MNRREALLTGAALSLAPQIARGNISISAKAGCEILLRVKDNRKDIGDVAHDSKTDRRGDVCFVAPIGWTWGDCERGGPTYEHVETTPVPRERHFKIADSELETVRRIHPDKVNEDGFLVVRSVDHVEVAREERPIHTHIHGNHPFWRIVRLTNVRRSTATILEHPEQRTHEKQPETHLQSRGYYFDIEATNGALRKFLDDDSRSEPIFVSDMSETEFKGLIRRRPTLPWAVGAIPGVFG